MLKSKTCTKSTVINCKEPTSAFTCFVGITQLCVKELGGSSSFLFIYFFSFFFFVSFLLQFRKQVSEDGLRKCKLTIYSWLKEIFYFPKLKWFYSIISPNQELCSQTWVMNTQTCFLSWKCRDELWNTLKSVKQKEWTYAEHTNFVISCKRVGSSRHDSPVSIAFQNSLCSRSVEHNWPTRRCWSFFFFFFNLSIESCAQKNIIYLSTFYRFTDVRRTLEKFINHEPICYFKINLISLNFLWV